MNINLKWKSGDGYVMSHIPIFYLKIQEKENHFAEATLTIDALTVLPSEGTEGVLEKEDGSRLFKGQLKGSPTKVDSYFADIVLIAIPVDFKDKNEVLQKQSRIAPYWNELWINPQKRTDYEENQSVQLASLYCDRITGDLSWSDWFHGKHHLHLDQHFFQDSLFLKTHETPLKKCTVNVTAHWIQSDTGIDDLSPAIRRAFPHYKMSTYTERSLSAKWPQRGQRIGRSGIWVLKSDLKPVPATTKFSPPLSLEKEEKTYRVIRHWFKPSLWVRWHYQQKRTEVLSVTLEHHNKSLIPNVNNHKILNYTLQNINPDPHVYSWQPELYYSNGSKVIHENKMYGCHTPHTSDLSFEKDERFWNLKRTFHTPLGHPARASFFLTDQGYLATEHALEIAKKELAKTARCLEVYLEGRWDELESVTTDMTISLSDSRLPEGKFIGKVVKHMLIAEGETGKRWAQLTLLSPSGYLPLMRREENPIPSHISASYCESDYQVFENAISTTPSGIQYFRYDDQCPPNTFQRSSILHRIELKNGPLEQEEQLVSQTYESAKQIDKALRNHATRIRLYFKDLRTRERLEHHINVKVATPWGPPPPR